MRKVAPKTLELSEYKDANVAQAAAAIAFSRLTDAEQRDCRRQAESFLRILRHANGGRC